ncbi:hypothetical protein BT63DRAFT_435436 [Microthyrium microscopicum]|uniref:Uncharacterized protein n=1 Tax=Microthyrium microscopicum TaxID=703497 RepID=A0A6A6US55_9PEZI|nr:hypothetical protein BT63DRAFT_435436 [Microthyrium microscopicum]
MDGVESREVASNERAQVIKAEDQEPNLTREEAKTTKLGKKKTGLSLRDSGSRRELSTELKQHHSTTAPQLKDGGRWKCFWRWLAEEAYLCVLPLQLLQDLLKFRPFYDEVEVWTGKKACGDGCILDGCGTLETPSKVTHCNFISSLKTRSRDSNYQKIIPTSTSRPASTGK